MMLCECIRLRCSGPPACPLPEIRYSIGMSYLCLCTTHHLSNTCNEDADDMHMRKSWLLFQGLRHESASVSSSPSLGCLSTRMSCSALEPQTTRNHPCLPQAESRFCILMRLKARWLIKLMSENSQQTPGTLVVVDLVPWKSRTSKVSQLFLRACNVSTL